MKKYKITIFTVAICFLFALGCKKVTINQPNITNTTPPGLITGVKVLNQNGKAQITYTLPADKDLLYVKAVYETSPGKLKEVKASYYTNNLTVDGFGDSLAHTIKMYSVNSSEIASEAVTVTINPLTPAYITAYRSIQVVITFGGFNITCNNPTAENLAIIPLVDTAGKGQFVQTVGLDNIYSNSIVIQSAIRGQPAILRKYGFVVRDRWLNHSDTMFLQLTPIFEQMLPKSEWSTYRLNSDVNFVWPGVTEVYKIYDNNFNAGWPDILFSVENASTPQTATLDLGKAHTFSRMRVNPFLELGNVYYARGSMRDFEIWGSNAPNVNGSTDASWTLLTTCHVIKPSGAPVGTETTADYNYGHDGWAYDFPAGLASYRFVRIRNLRNWSGSYFMSIAEFTLWGN